MSRWISSRAPGTPQTTPYLVSENLSALSALGQWFYPATTGRPLHPLNVMRQRMRGEAGRVAATGQSSSWPSRGRIAGAQIPLNTMSPYCRHELCALQAFFAVPILLPGLPCGIEPDNKRRWGVGSGQLTAGLLAAVGRNLEEVPRGAKGPTIEKSRRARVP